MSYSQENWHADTTLVHGGTTRSQFGETSESLFMTQGFVYESAEEAEKRFVGDKEQFTNDDPCFIYSRYANPTIAMFEERMSLLEGADAARATASGMAAVNVALLSSVEKGCHIVAPKALFGSCRYIIETLLPKLGIESTLIDGTNYDQWKSAMRPNTSVCFLESPTNPMLEVIDISIVSEIAHSVGARLIVDNVFATPLWQSPLTLGADIVVYSTTKHIDGQGRCLGGIVLSDQEWIEEKLHPIFKHTGPCMSPFNAWVMLKGLETLPIRVHRQTDTAKLIANELAKSPKVSKLNYPGRDDHPNADVIKKQMTGGSNLIAFELKGGKDAAFGFCNKLNIVQISNNLGDSKSLVTHPATTTHQSLTQEARDELGISDGLLRLSIGLENSQDLITDILSSLS